VGAFMKEVEEHDRTGATSSSRSNGLTFKVRGSVFVEKAEERDKTGTTSLLRSLGVTFESALRSSLLENTTGGVLRGSSTSARLRAPGSSLRVGLDSCKGKPKFVDAPEIAEA